MDRWPWVCTLVSCPMQSWERRAVVLGAGCIGLVTLMSLKARGVSEIYVADVLDKRLEKARELGGYQGI